ncbi:MAG TPA: trypsin-like peptidase domain-containing protein [Kofleriaceae bacterium]|nr:trypsin-like peptidase domain-containing protein [Kofleriaceae bacterium]
MSARRLTRLALAIAALASCREVDTVEPEAADHAPSVAKPAPEPSRLLYPNAPSSFVDIVQRAKSGVVGIRSSKPVKSGPAAMYPNAPETTADVALGTGFLIEAKGVYVLTNDHIAAGATELLVSLPGGKDVPAKVIGRDPRLDLALLSIDEPRLTALPLGDSDVLKVGEWIVVLGNPFGNDVTAAAGIVSSNGSNGVSLVEDRATSHRSYLQVDARIHRGNSGGPVLDTAGQVVGVAIATSDRPTELSFAIPINRAKEIIGALRDYGQVARSWLGARVIPVSPELAAQLGTSSIGGAYVTEIVPGSPAAHSTLRVGDVILKWGPQAVDARNLPWVVSVTPNDTRIQVSVWRNKTEMRLDVITAKVPQ